MAGWAALARVLEAALTASDPAPRVRERLAAERPPRAPVWGLAVGKAAGRMAAGAQAAWGDVLRPDSLAITVDGAPPAPRPWDTWWAAHPLPDARGLAAAAEVRHRLTRLPPDVGVLVLLSGGASALLPAPPPGLTLEDLRRTTAALLAAGRPIGELNAVRKHLSRLAGGRLAALAHPRPVHAWILSDVPDDALDRVGSGPTLPDPTTYAEALRVVVDVPDVPAAVRAYLCAGAAGAHPETAKTGDPRLEAVRNERLGGNEWAREAAVAEAAALGYPLLAEEPRLQGEARAVGRAWAQRARGLAARGQRGLLLAGGETTVTVVGSGRGGRNQELALAAALELDSARGIVLAALATDGRDGPTDAAGAWVDGATAARIRAAGLDPATALARNDSYSALAAAGSLLRTGPTGTQVNDLLVVLLDPADGSPPEPTGPADCRR